MQIIKMKLSVRSIYGLYPPPYIFLSLYSAFNCENWLADAIIRCSWARLGGENC